MSEQDLHSFYLFSYLVEIMYLPIINFEKVKLSKKYICLLYT